MPEDCAAKVYICRATVFLRTHRQEARGKTALLTIQSVPCGCSGTAIMPSVNVVYSLAHGKLGRVKLKHEWG